MPTITSLHIGDDAVITVTFTVGGVLTNPTTVTWRVRHYTAATPTVYVYGTDAEATRPSTGTFKLTIPVTIEGRYYVLCEGTGAAKGAAEGEFSTRVSQLV